MVGHFDSSDKPDLVRVADVIEELSPACRQAVLLAATWRPPSDPYLPADLFADIVALHEGRCDDE